VYASEVKRGCNDGVGLEKGREGEREREGAVGGERLDDCPALRSAA